ncbi:hypothetical protein CA85_17070 [Allorhodopirellula solitaria]|uniref:Uncharacterized protein n=1 Tax=Allorhodopirellula solitaria TaxID=2527987 RepID=A0A5C5YE71_9BACT|nr:hypothetical protein CA85_17070 [Allorhodopirellula solitaria]
MDVKGIVGSLTQAIADSEIQSRETEPSSAEVLAWQGISRSPAFPCKSGTPMVLSVPGERLFVRDAFLNDHWIREPCLKKPSAVLCARFRRMNQN